MNNLTAKGLAIALGLLVATLVVGGCGSGSSEDSTVAPQANSARTPAPSTAAPKQRQKGPAVRPRGEKKKNPRGAEKNGNAQSKGGQKQTSDPQSRRSRGEKVVKSLQKLVGSGGNDSRGVVASPKNVRKIVKEVMEGSDGQGSTQNQGESIENLVEGVFGDR